MFVSPPQMRHPEAPRFRQRGEGSRAGYHGARATSQMVNTAGRRNDAVAGSAQ